MFYMENLPDKGRKNLPDLTWLAFILTAGFCIDFYFVVSQPSPRWAVSVFWPIYGILIALCIYNSLTANPKRKGMALAILIALVIVGLIIAIFAMIANNLVI